MTEQYKIINGFEKYSVSTFGNVKNNKTQLIMKKSKDKDGYNTICLYKNNSIQMTCKIHRLVALAFLQPIKDKQMVNHIDNNRSNNNMEFKMRRCKR